MRVFLGGEETELFLRPFMISTKSAAKNNVINHLAAVVLGKTVPGQLNRGTAGLTAPKTLRQTHSSTEPGELWPWSRLFLSGISMVF